VVPALVHAVTGFAKQRSPDAAKRNPGNPTPLRCRSRITLALHPGYEERTKEKIGSRTPTDAIRILPCLTDTAAPRSRGAHLSAFRHGSRPKECFISRSSASGQASWDVADSGLSVERVLPAPACPEVQRATAHPGPSAEGMMPKAARKQGASPPAGAALAPAPWPADQSASDRARFDAGCNGNGDACQ
jgi:hypothetical protein